MAFEDPSRAALYACHDNGGYLRLEDLGLIERCNPHGGRRTTHLRLTEAGRRLAEDLLLGRADEDDVDEGDEVSIDLEAIEFLPIEMPVEDLASAPDADEATNGTF